MKILFTILDILRNCVAKKLYYYGHHIIAWGLLLILFLSALLPANIYSDLYRRMEVLNDPYTSGAVLMLEILANAYILLYLRTKSAISKPVVLLLVFYTLLAALGGLHSVNRITISMRLAISMCFGPLVLLCTVAICHQSELLEKLSRVFELIFQIYSLFVISSAFAPEAKSFGGMTYHTGGVVRFSAILGQPNFCGGLLAGGVVFYVCQLCFSRYKFDSKYQIIALGVLVIGMLLTYSRGAWIACLGGLFAVFWRVPRGILFVRRAMPVICLLILIAAYVDHTQMGQQIFTRVTQSSPSRDDSVRNRILIWRASIQLVQEHPVIGIGYGAFMNAIESYQPKVLAREKYPDAVNSYLTLAAEAGLPAAIIYVSLIIIISIQYLSRLSREQSVNPNEFALFSIFLSQVIFALTSCTVDVAYSEISTWMLMGFLYAQRRLPRGAEEHNSCLYGRYELSIT